jgi:hypothetical protein
MRQVTEKISKLSEKSQTDMKSQINEVKNQIETSFL